MAYEDLLSSTPYDDVFKTLVHDQRELILPLLNETFGTAYEKDRATIEFLSDEHFLMVGGNPDKMVSDSSFKVTMDDAETIYHYECQSTPDHTMAVRFFQYDSQIALEQGILENKVLEVHFPHSAALYLRSTSTTPDELIIRIGAYGSDNFIEYPIPIIKLKKYNDIETIFRKKLYILIPFYIFLHEAGFKEYESSEEKREELFGYFSSIVERLDQLVQEGNLGLYQRNMIVELSRKVIANIANKYEHVQKGVIDIMGGKVLEYEAKTNFLKGMAEGEVKGKIDGLVSAAYNLMNKLGCTIEQAVDLIDVAPDIRSIVLEKLKEH